MQAPLRLDASRTSSTMAISMSVAVSVSLPSRTAIMTFARMGMVLRRSTTLWTWASALIKVARSALSFMVSFLLGPALASGPRTAGKQANRNGECSNTGEAPPRTVKRRPVVWGKRVDSKGSALAGVWGKAPRSLYRRQLPWEPANRGWHHRRRALMSDRHISRGPHHGRTGKPPRARNLALSAAACRKSGALAAVGESSAGRGPGSQQADHGVDRLCQRATGAT